MFKLAIIVGTDRPNSKSQEMAEYVKEQYSKRGVDAHIFSMADFPLGSVVGGPYGKEIPEIEAFRAPILACDALLFVCPDIWSSLSRCFQSIAYCFCWHFSWGLWLPWGG